MQPIHVKTVMGLLQQYGLRQSFSRVGMPGDNAWSESFFATMKKELIHWTHYETKEAARAAVFEYIYCFYNVTRIQERLGYMSPREYLRSLRTDRLTKVALQIVYKTVEVLYSTYGVRYIR
jgi:putative transposase